jgi:hypothetical protein
MWSAIHLDRAGFAARPCCQSSLVARRVRAKKAASCSNAIFMDGSFACAARCLAPATLCRYMSARDDI